MSDFFHKQRQSTGSLAVALQFGLLLLAVMAAPRVWQGHLPIMALALAGLSVLLGVWTLAYNRLGNFNRDCSLGREGVAWRVARQFGHW